MLATTTNAIRREEWQLSAADLLEPARPLPAQKLPIEAFLNYMTGIGPRANWLLLGPYLSKADELGSSY